MNQYLAIYQVRQMLQKLISETADADLADKLKNIDHQLNYFLDKGIDFKQVVDGIDESIFITDNKGNVLYVNPAFPDEPQHHRPDTVFLCLIVCFFRKKLQIYFTVVDGYRVAFSILGKNLYFILF